MKNFFWPQNVKPEPGIIARIGRIVHWMGAAYFFVSCLWALLILAVLGYQIATQNPVALWHVGLSAYAQAAAAPAAATPDPVSFALGNAFGVLGIGALVYISTRGIRYILAGE